MSNRLLALHPRWLGEAGRGGLGLSFDCPVHREPCRFAVYFANPLDGGAAEPLTSLSVTRWQRTGDTFETLSLSPSVHILDTGRCPTCGANGLRWQDGQHQAHLAPSGLPCADRQALTHWHGHITEGVVTP